MTSLLIVTAALEAPTGLALLVLPAAVVQVLFGSVPDATGALVARVAGVALLALGAACWLARRDHHSGAAIGLIAAMLIYNTGVAAVFVYADLGVGASGIGLWPAVVAHVGLAMWCLKCLRGKFAEHD